MMDNILFMTFQQEATIRRWMLATVSNGGIERFDDLHVNVIDEGWSERAKWVAAGITAFGLAIRIRRELGLDVTVALGFSLVEAEGSPAEKFETQEEFEKQLDSSPPSLYLFKTGDQQHLSATTRVDPLPDAFSSQLPEGTKSFLSQWLAEDGNHYRSVFVEVPNHG
jgi:hypothetical protein